MVTWGVDFLQLSAASTAFWSPNNVSSNLFPIGLSEECESLHNEKQHCFFPVPGISPLPWIVKEKRENVEPGSLVLNNLICHCQMVPTFTLFAHISSIGSDWGLKDSFLFFHSFHTFHGFSQNRISKLPTHWQFSMSLVPNSCEF